MAIFLLTYVLITLLALGCAADLMSRRRPRSKPKHPPWWPLVVYGAILAWPLTGAGCVAVMLGFAFCKLPDLVADFAGIYCSGVEKLVRETDAFR